MALISGGSSAPSGSAGGDLTGTYPSPTLDLTKAHVYTGNQTAPALVASGLTGSVAASRYVGATASGAPTTGAHAVGDFIIDQTGGVYVCTVLGTPGTWVAVGGFTPARNVGQTELDFNNLAVNTTTVTVPFVFGGGDATMLNLTSATAPKPVTAGTYSFTLLVHQLGGGDNGPFTAKLVVDDDYYSISPIEVASYAPNEQLTLAVTWFCSAASPCRADILTVANDSYSGNLYVQRLA